MTSVTSWAQHYSQGKLCLKRWVFRRLRKTVSDCAEMTWCGRLFQTRTTATRTAWWPSILKTERLNAERELKPVFECRLYCEFTIRSQKKVTRMQVLCIVKENCVWREGSSEDYRKQSSDCADVTWCGRVFQTREAATGTARSPYVDSLCTVHNRQNFLCL